MTIKFKITTTDGKTFTGPVQGNGGHVGGDVSHLPFERAAKKSLDRMLRIVQLAQLGEPLPVFEPVMGHVVMYPGYTATGNGDPVAVDLRRGAKVEVLR